MSSLKRQPRSDNPRRIQLLRDAPPASTNGIDYLEVTSADQRSLKVVFVHPVTGITRANCRIEGGVRIRGIQVLTAVANGNELAVTVDQAGDFSWYDFVLFDPSAPDFPPPKIDPCLASVRFSFKAQCPSEFDCRTDVQCPPAVLPEPLLDYLAKDYASFRRLMLDRMGQLMPNGAQNHPADFSVALVETLAHVADLLSYRQDAVATEAYLGTSRRRISLRRHARLLDYAVHDGCNSRAYLCLAVAAGADAKSLPARSTLLTQGDDPTQVVLTPAQLERQPEPETVVFETLHDLTLQSAHNRIVIHSWGNPNYCLARGSVEAALVDQPKLALAKGMVLIAEEVLSPTTGRAPEADATRRCALRIVSVDAGRDELTGTDLQLIRWHADDVLPFPLCVTAEFEQGGATEVRQIAVMRGNVVLADQGFTRAAESMVPPLAPPGKPYRPRLREGSIAYAEPYTHQSVLDEGWSAIRALQQDPRRATPANMHLESDDPAQFGDQPAAGALPWTPRRDLLASDRFAQEFVVETEFDGSTLLRFGDNRFGLQPEPGAHLLASYRQGAGTRGNVGPDSITRLVSQDAAIAPFVRTVRNPLAAQGGADPESPDAIKLQAPEAFRTQERAVTQDDYARRAERHPQVQRAAARLRWTGSWYTMFVSIDRKGGAPLDDEFRALMLQHLDRYRLAGYDLDLRDPAFVPLDIELGICVLPGYLAAAVKQALLQRLSNGLDPQGQPAFFHPDRFTFGAGLALSALVDAAQGVTGVASVEVITFQRWGRTPNKEREEGLIAAEPLEVLRLDNDPNFPENGRLTLTMRGGM